MMVRLQRPLSRFSNCSCFVIDGRKLSRSTRTSKLTSTINSVRSIRSATSSNPLQHLTSRHFYPSRQHLLPSSLLQQQPAITVLRHVQLFTVTSCRYVMSTIRWSSNNNSNDNKAAATATATATPSTSNTVKEKSILLPNKNDALGSPSMTTESSTSSNDSDTSSSTTTSSESGHLTSSSTSSSSTKVVSDAVVAATHEIEQRIKRVVQRVGGQIEQTSINVGDQIVVIIIAVFTSILLLAPYAVRHMKQSADTVVGYEDRLQTDDPVDEFVKLAKREWNIINGKIDDDNETNNNGTVVEEKNQKFIEVLLKDVLQSKTVQDAAQEFVVQILQSERFQTAIQRLVKELWNDLVSDPETVAQVIKLLEIAITSTPIKNAVMELIIQITIRETEIRNTLIQMIQNLGTEEQVLDAVVQLLTDATHTTLNDPEILDHSMEFATDVVGDDIVQQTAGEALRKSVEHAVKPATTILLSACGVGLLIFSFIALGYSRSSDTETQIFLSAARSIQSNATKGMSRILKWPLYTLPTILYHAILAAYDRIISLSMNHSPEWQTSLYNGVIDALLIPWKWMTSSLLWIISGAASILQFTILSVSKTLLGAANRFALFLGATLVHTVSLIEYGIQSILIHTWKYAIKGMQYVVSNCWSFAVHTASSIGQHLGRMFQRLYESIFSSSSSYEVW